MKNRRTAVAILLASFTVAAAAALAFLAVRHLGGGYSEGALKEQMTADINEFIRRFEVPQGDLDAVQGLYDSGVSEELADLSAQTLTKPGVNYEGYEKNIETKVLATDCGLTQEQYDLVVSSVTAICLADTYKAISEAGLVSEQDASEMLSALERRISDLESAVETQKIAYDNALEQLRTAGSSPQDATALAQISQEVFAMASEVESLEAKAVTVDQMNVMVSDLNALLSQLQAMGQATDETADALRAAIGVLEENSLTPDDKEELVAALGVASEGLAQKIVDQSNAIEGVAGDLSALVEKCEVEKAATDRVIGNVKLTLEGSLSDLEDAMNAQVDAAKNELSGKIDETNQAVASNKASAEASIEEQGKELSQKINETNQAVANVSGSLDAQQGELEGLINEAKANYSSYVQEVKAATAAGKQAVSDDTAAALKDVADAKSAAEAGITTLASSSEAAVSAQQTTSIAAVEAQEEDSVNAVKSAGAAEQQAIRDVRSSAETSINSALGDAVEAKNAAEAAAESVSELDALKDSLVVGTYSKEGDKDVVTFTIGGF